MGEISERFNDERLDAIERALRDLVPELAQAMNPPPLAWQAADAIAQLRRERVLKVYLMRKASRAIV